MDKRLQPIVHSGERGIALIVVLALLAILIPVITMLSLSSKTELQVSRTYRGSLQNRAGIDSAKNLARQHLLMDAEREDSESERKNRFDAPSEQWADIVGPRQFGGANVIFRIIDENRRINLNWIVDSNGETSDEDPYYQTGRRLFDVLDISPAVFDRLVEYLKPDSSSRNSDEPSRQYLRSPKELLRIDGITKNLLYGRNGRRPLLRYVTIWPVRRPGSDESKEEKEEEEGRDEAEEGLLDPRVFSDGSNEDRQEAQNEDDQQNDAERLTEKNQNRRQINVNTASGPVLRSLLPSGMERENVVDLILSHRQSQTKDPDDRYFRSSEELMELSDEGVVAREPLDTLADRVRFDSRVFSVFVHSRSDGVTETARIVLDRQSESSDEDSSEETDMNVLWLNRDISLDAYNVFPDSTIEPGNKNGNGTR